MYTIYLDIHIRFIHKHHALHFSSPHIQAQETESLDQSTYSSVLPIHLFQLDSEVHDSHVFLLRQPSITITVSIHPAIHIRIGGYEYRILMYPKNPALGVSRCFCSSYLILSHVISSGIHLSSSTRSQYVDRYLYLQQQKNHPQKKTIRTPIRRLKCLLHSYPASTQYSVSHDFEDANANMCSRDVVDYAVCSKVVWVSFFHLQFLPLSIFIFSSPLLFS